MTTYEQAIKTARESKEDVRKTKALLDWENELKYNISILKNNNLSDEEKSQVEARISECKAWISKIKKKTRKSEVQSTELTYVEPEDYIPKEIRKKYKLGEYADD